jgi:hypothetical protein
VRVVKGGEKMNNYKIAFYVNSTKTEQTVKANSPSEAQNLIKAQYPNSKIRIITTTKL